MANVYEVRYELHSAIFWVRAECIAEAVKIWMNRFGPGEITREPEVVKLIGPLVEDRAAPERITP